MNSRKYINSFVKDTFKVKYFLDSETYLGNGKYILVSDKKHIITIIENPIFQNEISKHIQWLITKNKNPKLTGYLELPRIEAHMESRKDIGYISSRTRGIPLRYYCTCPLKEKNNMNWFSHVTGGFSKRIELSLKIIEALQSIHNMGYTLSDMSPDTILVSEQNNTIKFTASHSLSSYTHKSFMNGLPYYSDPTIHLGTGTSSVETDTYTCAIILFELLTSRHPFLANDINESVYNNSLITIIDSGEQDYLFSYEKSQNDPLFLRLIESYPVKLKDLFCDMFTIGKFNIDARPSLEDFKEELKELKGMIMTCCNCGNEFIATTNECNVCWADNSILVIDCLETITTTRPLVLTNIKHNSTLKPIPPTSSVMQTTLLNTGTHNIVLAQQDDSEESTRTIQVNYAPDKHMIQITNLCKNHKLNIIVHGNDFSTCIKYGQILTLNVGNGLITEIIPLQTTKHTTDKIYNSSIYGNITISPTVQIREVY